MVLVTFSCILGWWVALANFISGVDFGTIRTCIRQSYHDLMERRFSYHKTSIRASTPFISNRWKITCLVRIIMHKELLHPEKLRLFQMVSDPCLICLSSKTINSPSIESCPNSEMCSTLLIKWTSYRPSAIRAIPRYCIIGKSFYWFHVFLLLLSSASILQTIPNLSRYGLIIRGFICTSSGTMAKYWLHWRAFASSPRK